MSASSYLLWLSSAGVRGASRPHRCWAMRGLLATYGGGHFGHRKVMERGKTVRPAFQYLVKWLGYPVWQRTWEPESSVPSDSTILPVYKAQHGL